MKKIMDFQNIKMLEMPLLGTFKFNLIYLVYTHVQCVYNGLSELKNFLLYLKSVPVAGVAGINIQWSWYERMCQHFFFVWTKSLTNYPSMLNWRKLDSCIQALQQTHNPSTFAYIKRRSIENLIKRLEIVKNDQSIYELNNFLNCKHL